VQSDSDAALDNARHEVEFRFKQLLEMEPYAKSLAGRKPADTTKDNLVQNILYVAEKADWDNRLGELMTKIMYAQAKYIRLLEEWIGK
jgi:hypothetical protein